MLLIVAVSHSKPLVTQHPLRERFRAQLMTALYRAGRCGDALHAYRQGRRILVDELGIEPKEECQAVVRAILSGDPVDDQAGPSGVSGAASAGGAGTAPSERRGARGRRRWSVGRRVGVLVAAVLVVAVGVPAAWLLRDVVGGTLAADRGAADPQAAIAEYLGAGPLGGFGADDIRFGHVLCAERREALRAQASGISANVQRAAANHNAGFLHAETSGDRATVDGGRASVTTLVSLVFSTAQPGAPFFVGTPHPWTFRPQPECGHLLDWRPRTTVSSTARSARSRANGELRPSSIRLTILYGSRAPAEPSRMAMKEAIQWFADTRQPTNPTTPTAAQPGQRRPAASYFKSST